MACPSAYERTTTQIGSIKSIVALGTSNELENIHVSTLVVTASGSRIASIEMTRRWQVRIPSSELFVIESDSCHVAVSDVDIAAAAKLDFIERHSTANSMMLPPGD